MSHTISADPESFRSFFEGWLSEQNQHLQHLTNMASEHNQANPESLRALVEQEVKHYESYYKAKSKWAEHDVLAMLSPPWRSSLEDAFLWIGGFRPSTAFHLLYAKSGLQLEDQLAEMMRGFNTITDLSDLSQSQLAMVDKLQRGAIKQENDISHKMAKLQDTVADTTMVELSHSHATIDMVRNNDHEGGDDDGHENLVESALASKKKALEEILNRADEFRLRTIKNIMHILTPIQGVHFLIAASELHLKLHDWGIKMDTSGQPNGDR
ncbi:protein DOG1-like 3 [Argentina anserina]|uniref:protein DOG1-like 3 n=1 Tax=Argentina anserina TaxID=57926 RepID=UPI00217642DA|nr:protein DOG1-like 3 [Potentilla anserina]